MHLKTEFKILFCCVWKNNINHKNLCSSSGYLFNTHYWVLGGFLIAQLVKNPPAMRETWVRSRGWEDPLEKGEATHSSIVVWRILRTRQSMGSQRGGHDWATFTFTEFLGFVCSFRCIWVVISALRKLAGSQFNLSAKSSVEKQ